MITVRRIYAYLLAFAGLAMLSFAVADLAQLLVHLAFQTAAELSATQVRDTVAVDGAAALVGLPVWLLHWLWLARTVRRDPREAASTLRRLYLYGVLASAAAVLAWSAVDILEAVFDALVGASSSQPVAYAILRPAPFAFVAAVVWIGHWRTTRLERDSVGEVGGSATLRRWYVYGAAFVGFLMTLGGVQAVFETLWHTLASGQPGTINALPLPAAIALVGVGLWLVHWVVLSAATRAEDGESVLRSVYLFLGLAVGVIGALSGVSELLYYALARLLGVARPGGVGGDLLQAAAGPVSVAIVYGVAWAYARSALRQQAFAFGETQRQAGIRRLYTYVVALVSLAVLGAAVAGLLWVLADTIVRGSADADLLARYITLALVGLPVWLLHWRPSPADPLERRSTARRLYIYLSLIVAMLALIGSAATALYRVLGLILGEPMSVAWQADLAHALAIAVAAACVAAYQWRSLRSDARRIEPLPTPPSPEAADAVVEIRAQDRDSLIRALSALRATGVQVTVRSGSVS